VTSSYIEPLRHGNFTGYWAEDRGIVEFDVRGVGTVRQAHLLAVEWYDTIGESIALSLYGYRGDGTLTLADFAAGTHLIAGFHVPGAGLDLDVTAFVNEAIVRGYEFIGLNLRQDSMTMAGIVQYRPSHLEIIDDTSSIPEPSPVWLMGLSAVALRRLRRRSRAVC